MGSLIYRCMGGAIPRVVDVIRRVLQGGHSGSPLQDRENVKDLVGAHRRVRPCFLTRTMIFPEIV